MNDLKVILHCFQPGTLSITAKKNITNFLIYDIYFLNSLHAAWQCMFCKIRPRLLYFLVYKTADPNFWKMGKKIKSENRLFFKYFIPDRTSKWAKWEKNDPVWVRLRIKSSKYNQRLVHIYCRDRDIFQCDTLCTSPFMGTSQNLFRVKITDNKKISVSKMSTPSKFISESVTQLYCLTC